VFIDAADDASLGWTTHPLTEPPPLERDVVTLWW
jgi:hypothetical protein